MLRESLDAALKAAMKARDQPLRLSTLRLISAAIKDRDIAARAEDRCSGVSDDEILAILQKMVKQREDSAAQYDAGGRPDLAAQERAEIEVIREFLPRQLTEEETQSAVTAIIEELGAGGLKDMGRIMGVLKSRYPGSMDFGRAGAIVKRALG